MRKCIPCRVVPRIARENSVSLAYLSVSVVYGYAYGYADFFRNRIRHIPHFFERLLVQTTSCSRESFVSVLEMCLRVATRGYTVFRPNALLKNSKKSPGKLLQKICYKIGRKMIVAQFLKFQLPQKKINLQKYFRFLFKNILKTFLPEKRIFLASH